MSLTLSADELRELTGRTRAGAQRRALDAMGIAHFTDRDGRPKVLRVLVERLGGAMLTPREPQLRP